MRHADVIVIGAGVVGTFHAYHAARKGYSTLLIERNAFPNDASTRNFGIIAQSILAPTSPWAAFARESAEIYRSIQREHDITVAVTGSLYLASTAIEDAVLREFAALGLPGYSCVYLEAAEALRRFPCIQQAYCRGALLFPDDLTLDPRRLLRQLIPHMVQAGRVEYVPNTTVVSVEVSGGLCRVTDARGHAFSADRAIVCNGAEYRTLFPEIFRRSGMQICKLQMMRTAPQPGFQLPHVILSGLSIGRYPAFASCPSYESMRAQAIDEEIRAYGIHLLVKQAPDGSIVIGDSHEYREWSAAHALEETTNPAINEAILRYARTMLRLPTWSLQAMWNGYYPVYPDHDIYSAIIDGRIHIATGIGGRGMTTAPGFARHNIEAILS